MDRILSDLCTGTMLLTRLPAAWMRLRDTRPQAGRAVWTYPAIGILLGVVAAVANALARAIGVPPSPAAIWTVAVGVLLTGGLHEDGLADTADGFGGGATPERRLSIMRDSRVGTYGVLAVALSVAIRASCIAALPTTGAVACTLVAAGACGRGCIVGVLLFARPARPDGLAAALGPPQAIPCAAAVLIATVATAIVLPLFAAALALALSAMAALAVSRNAQRQVGGYTGDVLGAAEQISECLVLTLATVSA
jgi:adenosylcobinamide-GDP ribazoletransferase